MIRRQLKSRQMHRNGIPRVCFYFFIRNGIPSCFLFRGMVRKEIPRVCSYFFYTERNSEHFPLLRNGAERNPEGLLLFLSHCIEFQAFSLPRNSESILFRGTTGIPPGTNQLFHPFRPFRGMDLDLDSAPDLDPSVIKAKLVRKSLIPTVL